MSSADDREAIMSRVRGALAPLHQRAAMPDYTTELAVLREMIGNPTNGWMNVRQVKVERMNGRTVLLVRK